jgi:hypothetical protein
MNFYFVIGIEKVGVFKIACLILRRKIKKRYGKKAIWVTASWLLSIHHLAFKSHQPMIETFLFGFERPNRHEAVFCHWL